MKKMISFIQESGITDDMPEWYQRNVRLANLIGLLIGLTAGLMFAGIFYMVGYYEGIVIPFIGGLASTPTFLFTRYLRWYRFAFFQVALFPTLLINVLMGSMAVEEQITYAGYFAIAFAFSLLSFVMFDSRRQRRELIISLVFNYIVLCLTPLFSQYLDYSVLIEVDNWDLRLSTHGWLLYLGLFVGVGIAYSSTLLLVSFNATAEKKSDQLLDEATVKAKLIAANEKELKQNLVQIKKAQEEEKERQWMINDGIAELTSILRKT
ncbi:MAG: hypothetical protein AAFQ98_05705, partial [Bacteroidota bacterium]